MSLYNARKLCTDIGGTPFVPEKPHEDIWFFLELYGEEFLVPPGTQAKTKGHTLTLSFTKDEIYWRDILQEVQDHLQERGVFSGKPNMFGGDGRTYVIFILDTISLELYGGKFLTLKGIKVRIFDNILTISFPIFCEEIASKIEHFLQETGILYHKSEVYEQEDTGKTCVDYILTSHLVDVSCSLI